MFPLAPILGPVHQSGLSPVEQRQPPPEPVVELALIIAPHQPKVCLILRPLVGGEVPRGSGVQSQKVVIILCPGRLCLNVLKYIMYNVIMMLPKLLCRAILMLHQRCIYIQVECSSPSIGHTLS